MRIKHRLPPKKYYFLPVQDYVEELGTRISIARRSLRLSQRQLAEKSQTSLATYKRIEQGDMTVAVGTILSVLYCLDELESAQCLLADYESASEKLPRRVRESRKPRPTEDIVD
ncbi:MAG: multiprotein-bridging factor 1 family protein [Duodenibacillus sp.]